MTYQRYERPRRPRREGSGRLLPLVFLPFVLVFVYLVAPGPWHGSDDAPKQELCAAGCVATAGQSAPVVAQMPAASVKPAAPQPYANQDPTRWMKTTGVAP